MYLNKTALVDRLFKKLLDNRPSMEYASLKKIVCYTFRYSYGLGVSLIETHSKLINKIEYTKNIILG